MDVQAEYRQLGKDVVRRHRLATEHFLEEEVVGCIEPDLLFPHALAEGPNMIQESREQIFEAVCEGAVVAGHGERPEVDVVEVNRAREA